MFWMILGMIAMLALMYFALDIVLYMFLAFAVIVLIAGLITKISELFTGGSPYVPPEEPIEIPFKTARQKWHEDNA